MRFKQTAFFCACVPDMDVGDGELGARRVGGSAKFASDNHASMAHEEYLCVQGTWIGVHVYPRSEVSLLRRTAQGCWVTTWKFTGSQTPLARYYTTPTRRYHGRTLIRPFSPACATPSRRVIAHTQVRDPRGSADTIPLAIPVGSTRDRNSYPMSLLER